MANQKLPDLTRVNGFEYKPNELVLSPNSPMESAKRLLSDRYLINATQLLYRHRGTFFCWQSSHYEEVSSDYLKADINLFLDCAKRREKGEDGKFITIPFHPKRSHVNEIYGALESLAYLGDILQPPFWLGDNVPDLPPSEILACENGLLHLPTRSLLPHTPTFFTHNTIGYPYDKTITEPSNWLSFLQTLWPDDQESIDALQEMFGYCLTANTEQQKAFMIIGPKRSGKGTIARILEEVIGAHNVVAPTMSSLSTNFGRAPLIGKRLAIISDARMSNKADSAAIAECILTVTGEDVVTIDRKNREAWTGKIDVRFLIMSNELPKLADASGSLASRFIVFILRNSFFGREDHSLISRLRKERSAILLWAIEGYERLMARGHFIQPDSASDAIQILEDIGSPILAFVRDRCTIDPARMTPASDLYEAWTSWCGDQGRGIVSTLQTFGRDLHAAVPSLKTVQPRELNRVRCYQGIGLSSY